MLLSDLKLAFSHSMRSDYHRNPHAAAVVNPTLPLKPLDSPPTPSLPSPVAPHNTVASFSEGRKMNYMLLVVAVHPSGGTFDSGGLDLPHGILIAPNKLILVSLLSLACS